MMIILYVLAFTTRQILSSCDYEPPFCRNENVNRYDVYKNLGTRSNLYKDIDCKEYTETRKRKRVTSKLNNKRNKVKIANKLRKILLPATKKLPKNKVAALKRRLRDKNLRRNDIYTKIKGITNGTYGNYRGDDSELKDNYCTSKPFNIGHLKYSSRNEQNNPGAMVNCKYDGIGVYREKQNKPKRIFEYVIDEASAQKIKKKKRPNRPFIYDSRSDRHKSYSYNPDTDFDPEPFTESPVDPSRVDPEKPNSETPDEPSSVNIDSEVPNEPSSIPPNSEDPDDHRICHPIQKILMSHRICHPIQSTPLSHHICHPIQSILLSHHICHPMTLHLSM